MSDKILMFPKTKRKKPETLHKLTELQKEVGSITAVALFLREDGTIYMMADGDPSFYDVRRILTCGLNYTYEMEGL